MSSATLAQVEQAKHTLAALQAEGANLELPRHVVYFFYGDDLAGLSKELSDRGLTVHKSGDEQFWHVDVRHRSLSEAGYDIESLKSTDCIMADRTEVTNDGWRTTILKDLYLLAEEFGAYLDGWHAQVD